MTTPNTGTSWNSAQQLYETLWDAGYTRADSPWEELSIDERLAWQTVHNKIWWDGYSKAVANPINPQNNAPGRPA